MKYSAKLWATARRNRNPVDFLGAVVFYMFGR